MVLQQLSRDGIDPFTAPPEDFFLSWFVVDRIHSGVMR